MFNLIEKVSKKPEHKRRIYAVSISLGITLVIFVVWLSVILPPSVREEIASTDDSTRKAESPIGAFGRNTAQAFGALKEQINTIKESMKITPSVYNAGSSTDAEAVVY